MLMLILCVKQKNTGTLWNKKTITRKRGRNRNCMEDNVHGTWNTSNKARRNKWHWKYASGLKRQILYTATYEQRNNDKEITLWINARAWLSELESGFQALQCLNFWTWTVAKPADTGNISTLKMVTEPMESPYVSDESEPAPAGQQSMPTDKVTQTVNKPLSFDINHAD